MRRITRAMLNSPRLLSALSTEDKDEHALLLEAVINDDYETALELITVIGVDLEGRRESAVCVAAQEGREKILNLLLDYGGDAQEPDLLDHMWLRRPIHLAASKGHVGCVQCILAKGVDVNSRDSDHRTALHWACTYGHADMVEYLISKGASVNMAQIDGFTPLHAATCLGHAVVCQILIQSGADVNQADRDSWTALHTAACYGYETVVNFLLHAGASVDKVTSDSETAFHIACSSGHLKIAELLHQWGSQINLLNSNGFTPFHLSIYYNKYEIALFLIKINANIETVNNAGQTPFYLAVLRGEERLLRLMIEAGCVITDHVTAPIATKANNMSDQIKYLSSNPRRLRELCCIRVRKILGPNMTNDVQTLPIPESLKDIIGLKHF